MIMEMRRPFKTTAQLDVPSGFMSGPLAFDSSVDTTAIFEIHFQISILLLPVDELSYTFGNSQQ